MIHLVIMAGGKGTRFWPLSRATQPKQFLTMVGDISLLEYTIKRHCDYIDYANMWVVGNQDQKVCLDSAVTHIPSDQILYEPMGRNTAPCIAWAAMELIKKDPDAVMVIVPADHYIENTGAYLSTIQQGVAFVQKTNQLITIGITPTFPHTGYGYIEVSQVDNAVAKVTAFKEKPDEKTAAQYIQTGRYFWNSGIFIWKAKKILDLIQTHLPDLFAEMSPIQNYQLDQADYVNKIYRHYEAISGISIDYGVMEKAVDDIYLIRSTFDWSDIGNWTALESFWQKDQFGNAANGNVVAINSHGNIVYSKKRLIALADVSDFIIVDSEDALMILPKSSDQKVKDIYQAIPKQYQ